MSFIPEVDFALYDNKEHLARPDAGLPKYKGTLKVKTGKGPTRQIKCICWDGWKAEPGVSEKSGNARPYLAISVDRYYYEDLYKRQESLQGEDVVDHGKVETDRDARLDAMEQQLAGFLDMLGRVGELDDKFAQENADKLASMPDQGQAAA
jgi:hypothetical protein